MNSAVTTLSARIRIPLCIACLLAIASGSQGQTMVKPLTLGSSEPLNTSGVGLFWQPEQRALVIGMPFLGMVLGDFSVSLGESSAEGDFSFASGWSWASSTLSTAFGASVASGMASLSFGEETYAIGYASLAGGGSSFANGDYSVALGNSAANGFASVALGDSTAGGHYATSTGFGTEAGAFASLAIGRYNIGGYTDNSGTTNDGNTQWFAADPIFEIGNGTAIQKSNALTIFKNGNAVFYGTSNTIPNQNLTGGSTSILTLGLADDRYPRLSAGGLLGLGTTTPQQPLHISSPTNAYLKLQNTSSYGAGATPYTGILFHQAPTTQYGKGGIFYDAYDGTGGGYGRGRLLFAVEPNLNATNVESNIASSTVFAVDFQGFAEVKGQLLVKHPSSSALVVAGAFDGTARGVNAVDIQSLSSAGIAGGARSIVLGNNNSASGERSAAIGNGNFASFDGAILIGNYNGASPGGTTATAVGSSNSVGVSSTAIGYSNAVDEYSTALGYQNTVTGAGTGNGVSMAVGYANSIVGDYSYAFGKGNTVTASHATAIGEGITNVTANSLQIGVSNVAKMTLDSAGNLGVGTTSPQARVHVAGALKVDGVVRVTAPAGDIPMFVAN